MKSASQGCWRVEARNPQTYSKMSKNQFLTTAAHFQQIFNNLKTYEVRSGYLYLANRRKLCFKLISNQDREQPLGYSTSILLHCSFNNFAELNCCFNCKLSNTFQQAWVEIGPTTLIKTRFGARCSKYYAMTPERGIFKNCKKLIQKVYCNIR